MKSTGESSIKKDANFAQPLPEILSLIVNKYDRILPYHNSEHTRKVVKRAFLIGQALGLNDKQFELLQIAASFHDLVSDFYFDEVEVEHQGKKLKVRKRTMKRENNEKESANEAERWMGEKGYLEEEIALVKNAILATIPDWDQEKGTVYQQGLNKDSDLIIRALCLADLGAAGISARDYLNDPFNLFLEEYPDFHQFILGERELTAEEKGFYLEKFRDFINLQANFVQGREGLFENEIEGQEIDEEKKNRLRELFSNFYESYQLMLTLANEIKQEDFNSLVARFRNLKNPS